MKILERWSSISAERRALIAQVARYGIVGLGITLVQAAIYWILATWAHWHSQIANGAGYGVAVMLGYVLHNRITFRDAKRPTSTAAHATRGVKFVAVSLLSLALNALWVWLCVSWRGWPTWTPIPGMLFITPGIVFVLNRQWVFGER
ncbi:GtrA family protein [Sphingobium subterraneum]|uniref:Putative flippase GtrA n=1 Tax=Sphingobium subterraneum TaxID=627688 RepID=A0A841J2Y0_9SPHN|nr:GtrA family protein [Sphingobium subterraneum]MBB6125104.1 putative flippase GtrA [Sphingobium subterraneum]